MEPLQLTQDGKGPLLELLYDALGDATTVNVNEDSLDFQWLLGIVSDNALPRKQDVTPSDDVPMCCDALQLGACRLRVFRRDAPPWTSPIELAACCGHNKCIRYFVVGVGNADVARLAPLVHAAATYGHADTLMYLHKLGADLATTNRCTRITACHIAARGGHLQCLRTLLQLVPREVFTTRVLHFDTVAHFAACAPTVDCLRFVHERGFDMISCAEEQVLRFCRAHAHDGLQRGDSGSPQFPPSRGSSRGTGGTRPRRSRERAAGWTCRDSVYPPAKLITRTLNR